MKKLNLKTLSRNEMRNIIAGKTKGLSDQLGCVNSSTCSEGCWEIDRTTSQPKCSGCCIV